MSEYMIEPTANGKYALYRKGRFCIWDAIGVYQTLEKAKEAVKNLSREIVHPWSKRQ